MFKRVITGTIVVALALIIVLCAKIPFIVEITVALLSVLALVEVFSAMDLHKKKGVMIGSAAFATLLPFVATRPLWMSALCFGYAVFLFVRLITCEPLEQGVQAAGLPFIFSITITFAFSSLIFLRDIGQVESTLNADDGVCLIVLALTGSWLADAGAFLIGRFLGRHKLSPVISPHKTVEGLLGGIAANMAGFALAGWLYDSFLPGRSNVLLLLALGLVTALLGTAGDLTASYIKRSCHIKDFGDILPGHGGIMDRFDSVLLVAPFLYLATRLLQPVWPLITH